MTFEEAYALFNIFDESSWQWTYYKSMAEATAASELHLNFVSINPGYYVQEACLPPPLWKIEIACSTVLFMKNYGCHFLQGENLIKNWSLTPQYFNRKSLVIWTRACQIRISKLYIFKGDNHFICVRVQKLLKFF